MLGAVHHKSYIELSSRGDHNRSGIRRSIVVSISRIADIIGAILQILHRSGGNRSVVRFSVFPVFHGVVYACERAIRFAVNGFIGLADAAGRALAACSDAECGSRSGVSHRNACGGVSHSIVIYIGNGQRSARPAGRVGNACRLNRTSRVHCVCRSNGCGCIVAAIRTGFREDIFFCRIAESMSVVHRYLIGYGVARLIGDNNGLLALCRRSGIFALRSGNRSSVNRHLFEVFFRNCKALRSAIGFPVYDTGNHRDNTIQYQTFGVDICRIADIVYQLRIDHVFVVWRNIEAGRVFGPAFKSFQFRFGLCAIGKVIIDFIDPAAGVRCRNLHALGILEEIAESDCIEEFIPFVFPNCYFSGRRGGIGDAAHRHRGICGDVRNGIGSVIFQRHFRSIYPYSKTVCFAVAIRQCKLEGIAAAVRDRACTASRCRQRVTRLRCGQRNGIFFRRQDKISSQRLQFFTIRLDQGEFRRVRRIHHNDFAISGVGFLIRDRKRGSCITFGVNAACTQRPYRGKPFTVVDRRVAAEINCACSPSGNAVIAETVYRTAIEIYF